MNRQSQINNVMRSFFSRIALLSIILALVGVLFPLPTIHHVYAEELVVRSGRSPQGGGSLLRYDSTTGTFIGAYGIPLESSQGSDRIIFGPDGNLYASVEGGIARFIGTTGTFIDFFINDGSLEDSGQRVNGRDLAFGPNGQLYISASLGQVFQFDGETGSKTNFITNGTFAAGFRSLVIGGPEDNLYVGSEGFGNIQRYDRRGRFIDNFVPSNPGVTPRDMVFGPDGNLYVSDRSFGGMGDIKRYDGSTGDFLGVFVANGEGGLVDPWGLAFGPDDNLYISSLNSILRFNGKTGEFMDEFIAPGSGGLTEPTFLLFSPLPELRDSAIDNRFGTTSSEAAAQQFNVDPGMRWYRDYNASYAAPPPSGLEKMWTVGKIDENSVLCTQFGGSGCESGNSDGWGLYWHLLDLPTNLKLPQELCEAVTAVDEFTHSELTKIWNEQKVAITMEWESRVKKKVEEKVTVLGITPLVFPSVTLPEFPQFSASECIDDNVVRLTGTISVNWSFLSLSIPIWAASLSTTITINADVSSMTDENGNFLSVTFQPGSDTTVTSADFILSVITGTWKTILQDAIDDSGDEEIKMAVREKLRALDTDGNEIPDIDQKFYLNQLISQRFFAGESIPTQEDVLDAIFTFEKEPIRRQIEDNGRIGQYWEVANEPNWFPYIKPARYADYYSRYYRYIKGLDPTAKILNGGLFVKEVITDPASLIFGHFDFDVENIKLANAINSLILEESTQEWYDAFLASLPHDVQVDVANIHAYPVAPNGEQLKWTEVRTVMDQTASLLKQRGAQEVWLTEFGNIDWLRSEAEAANLNRQFVRYLKCNNAGITKWFWFRSPAGFTDLGGNMPETGLLEQDGLTLSLIGEVYRTEYLAKYCPDPDTDGDGLSNIDEITIYFTDPNNSDTDGDGLSDGDEVNTFGTLPKVRDSDGDGLTDGEEVSIFGTNPNKRDTDGDGVDDGHDRFPLDPSKGIPLAPIMELLLLQPITSAGDLNLDGCVDRVDLTLLLADIRGPAPHDTAFDLNGDGNVNIADARKLVTLFTKPRGTPCS